MMRSCRFGTLACLRFHPADYGAEFFTPAEVIVAGVSSQRAVAAPNTAPAVYSTLTMDPAASDNSRKSSH
jgi:hypothetical protein